MNNNIVNDQTSYPTNGELRGKTVLIIGSGNDLDDRKMGQIIDGDTYDIIARVNKHYGSPEDVGNRTDYIFTRWQQWLANSEWFTPEELEQAKEIVVLNQHTALKKFDSYSRTEYEWLCHKVGHEAVSAGAQVVDYFLNRGVKHVDIIGFGCKNGKFKRDKVYTKRSEGTMPTHNTTAEGVDQNPLYNWHLERQWEVNQAKVNFL